MLRNAPIRAYIPAKDVSRARKFYEESVGLVPREAYAGGVVYECGGTEVFLYPTGNAGTSRASQAFWQVEDVEAEVAELKGGGRPGSPRSPIPPPRSGTARRACTWCGVPALLRRRAPR